MRDSLKARSRPKLSRIRCATTIELMHVLGYPKLKLTPTEPHELLSDYLPWAETVKIPAPPPSVPACRDLNDVPFLELAFASRAQALITGDADLLALEWLPTPFHR